MPEKNWPRFRPVVSHDIDTEIVFPSEKQLAKRSYNLWKCSYAAVLANLAAIIGLAVVDKAGAWSVILAIIYIIIVPILDFFARHLSLYRGLVHDSAGQFRWFFFIQALDIFFGIFIIIGVAFGGGGGLMAMTACFKDKKWASGAICAVCVALYMVIVVLYIKLWINSLNQFRGKGYKLWGRSKK